MKDFYADETELDSDIKKNKRLSELIMGTWPNEAIKSVTRIEEGDDKTQHGWEADIKD